MDKSLSNFELPDSASKGGSESDHGSDKSDPIEILSMGDADQSSSNSNKSEEDFDSNLPETVTLLTHRQTGVKVYLVGTAHFSMKSKEDVANVIRATQPGMVLIELCAARRNILLMDEESILKEATEMNMTKILSNVRSSGVYDGIMYMLLLSMSAHITKQTGMAPGGEFREAVIEGKKVPNCEIRFADRPIHITLKRALSKLTWVQSFKLAWHLLTARDPISADDIEKCKQRDMIEQLLAEMSGEYPVFREVFLSERDVYMAYQIDTLSYWSYHKSKSRERGDTPPDSLVAVVGIGHVPGIVSLWGSNLEPLIADLLTVPPPSMTSIVVKYSIKISVWAFGGYLVYKYVPVPKLLKDNAQVVIQKLLTNLKQGSTGLKYTLP